MIQCAGIDELQVKEREPARGSTRLRKVRTMDDSGTVDSGLVPLLPILSPGLIVVIRV